jgi:hypothetical protein
MGENTNDVAAVSELRGSGFGASFGRDLYRGAKKNPVLFAIIGGLPLAFGWQNLFLGCGRVSHIISL